MNWADLIRFAESVLQDTSANEALKRAAISRAYYASHHLAKDAMVAKKIDCHDSNAGRETHASVVRALTNLDDDLGTRLDVCRIYREDADYASGSLSSLELENRLKEAISLAQAIEKWAAGMHASIPKSGQKRSIVSKK